MSEKKAWYKKWWGITGIVIGGLFVLGLLVPTEEPSKTAGPAAAPVKATPTTPAPTTTTVKKTWHEITALSGSGIKNTEPFTIKSNQWRIKWSAKGGAGSVFQAYVYKPEGDIPIDLIGNIANKSDSDVSNFYDPGTYYLKMNTANNTWTVAVEEYR